LGAVPSPVLRSLLVPGGVSTHRTGHRPARGGIVEASPISPRTPTVPVWRSQLRKRRRTSSSGCRLPVDPGGRRGPGSADGRVVLSARRAAVSRQAGWISPVVVAGGVVLWHVGVEWRSRPPRLIVNRPNPDSTLGRPTTGRSDAGTSWGDSSTSTRGWRRNQNWLLEPDKPRRRLFSPLDRGRCSFVMPSGSFADHSPLPRLRLVPSRDR
jgi:hypothetical protein